MEKAKHAYSGLIIAADNIFLSKGVQRHSLRGVSIEYDSLVTRIAMDLDIADPSREEIVRRVRDAVLDTGATNSVISEKMAREMGLQPVDTGVLVTATGHREVPVYIIDVLISGGLRVRNLRVFGSPMENREIEFILGMDVISRGKLVIDSSEGKTMVSFTMKV